MSGSPGTPNAPEALLLSGPLGAGKTTLIRRSLLPAAAGRRVVVLVNDAGAIPLDALLLGAGEVPAVGVAGGCFCCEAGGELLEALARIRDRLAPDLLIVEGSGLSSPEPLARSLTAEGYVLLGTLGVVAASQLDRLARDAALRAQLAAAGTIVLTGADRLDRAGLERARQAIAAVSDRPLRLAFEGEVRGSIGPLLAPGAGMGGARPGHAHTRAHALRLQPQGVLERQSLRRWLEAAPATILRVKGIVPCAESVLPLAVNAALGEVDLRPIDAAEPAGLWIAYEGEKPQDWLAALPSGFDPADWPALAPRLRPLGAFDERPHAAFLEGRRVASLEAAEAWLDRLRAARHPILLTSPLAREAKAALWGPAVWGIELVPELRLTAIDAQASALAADLVLCSGLVDAIVERIAARRPDLALLHLAEAAAIPSATISLRLDGAQEAALAATAVAPRAAHPRSPAR